MTHTCLSHSLSYMWQSCATYGSHSLTHMWHMTVTQPHICDTRLTHDFQSRVITVHVISRERAFVAKYSLFYRALLQKRPIRLTHDFQSRVITVRKVNVISRERAFVAEYSLFYRALLQKRPILLRSLLIVFTPQWYLGRGFLSRVVWLCDMGWLRLVGSLKW